MATRLYGESRGRRLSTRFILEGTDNFMSINRISQTGVWAEVSANNEKSVRKIKTLLLDTELFHVQIKMGKLS